MQTAETQGRKVPQSSCEAGKNFLCGPWRLGVLAVNGFLLHDEHLETCSSRYSLALVVEIDFIEMFPHRFIETFLNELPVTMNVDMEILIKF